MAFTAKMNIVGHLNIVGCLLKRRPTKGGSRAPQDPPPPPSYAPVGPHSGNDFCFLISSLRLLGLVFLESRVPSISFRSGIFTGWVRNPDRGADRVLHPAHR